MVAKKRFLGLIIISLGLYLIFTSGKSIISLMGAGSRIKNVQLRLQNTQKKNEDLKKKLAGIKSPAYIEKEAREKLNLAKEGETIVVLPSDIPVSNPKKETFTTEIPNWKKWYLLFAD